MIGQTKLKTNLEKLTADTFPHSLLLIGEKGCGKHTFTQEYILPKLNGIVSRDITKSVSLDTILEISVNPEPTLYIIDLDDLTDREQTILLKLVEEPYTQIYLLLLSQNISTVLPTIQNRCTIWNFESYSKEELLNFTSNIELTNWIKTPGKLILNSDLDIHKVKELCVKLLTSVKKISLSNLLMVTDRIDWNNKSTKLNADILYKVLIQTASDLIKDHALSIDAFNLTSKYVNIFLSNIQFDRKRMFEKYVLELKYGVT